LELIEMLVEIMPKKAFCKCGGQIATVYYETCYTGWETICKDATSPDPEDWDITEGYSLDHKDGWKSNSSQEHFECIECGEEFQSITDATTDGLIIWKDCPN
jgi:hypothetical protein